jgi:hypothetical protein
MRLLWFLALCVLSAASQRHYLSFCIVFKDEAAYLDEWIEFHRLLGVSQFHFYNNESRDKSAALLQRHVAAGHATLTDWPTRTAGSAVTTQCDAYAHCLRSFGNDSRWMGFFDVDEFLYPQRPQDRALPDVLRPFEQYGGVVVRNALFGSSGFINKPDGLVSENYVFRAPLEHPTYADDEDDVLFHVKSIVDARHGVGCGKFGAHVVFLDDPALFLVNERGERHVADGKNAPKGMAYVDLLRYNHYKAKSKADWDKKKSKGTVQGAPAVKKFAKLGNQWRNVDRNEVLDESIHRFLPALRRALGLKEGQYAQG